MGLSSVLLVVAAQSQHAQASDTAAAQVFGLAVLHGVALVALLASLVFITAGAVLHPSLLWKPVPLLPLPKAAVLAATAAGVYWGFTGGVWDFATTPLERFAVQGLFLTALVFLGLFTDRMRAFFRFHQWAGRILGEFSALVVRAQVWWDTGFAAFLLTPLRDRLAPVLAYDGKPVEPKSIPVAIRLFVVLCAAPGCFGRLVHYLARVFLVNPYRAALVGDTGLSFAVVAAITARVELLLFSLEAGADPLRPDARGYSALDYALEVFFLVFCLVCAFD